MPRKMTYEEFSDKTQWDTYGDEEGIWHYERVVGRYRVAIWLSGNDGFWKWSGEPIVKDKNPRKRLADRFVYDCGGKTAQEAFREAFEMMSADEALVAEGD